MSLKSVLIIDDDATIRALIKASLEDNGYDPLESQSGEDGLSVAKEKKPDCILLDWMMPNMDGISVLKELKKNEETRSIPVIMLTSKTEVSNVSESLTMGANDYIVKPFDTYNLIVRLEKILKS